MIINVISWQATLEQRMYTEGASGITTKAQYNRSMSYRKYYESIISSRLK